MNSLIRFILSTKTCDMWLKLALSLAIILLLMRQKRIKMLDKYEGFQQKEQFVIKMGNNIYDEFYVSVYDTVNLTANIIDILANSLIKNTQMDKLSGTKVLDINAKTGALCNSLHKKGGIECIGMDLAKNMVNYAKSIYREVDDGQITFMEFSEDPMQFDKNEFSHIVCLEMGFYEMPESMRRQMLLNIASWLKIGGYFIVHLVDEKKYNGGLSRIKGGLTNEKIDMENNIKRAIVDYGDFEYKMEMINNGKEETFTDKKTGCVRKNRMEWDMGGSLDENIAFIESCGFIQKGKYVVGDNYPDEYIYIFTCIYK